MKLAGRLAALTLTLTVHAAAAQNLCPGGLCGPSSTLSWVQADGTTKTVSWTLKTARAANVCTATTGVTTVTVTAAQLGLAPGTPGPLTISVPISVLALVDGVNWVNVASAGPGGPSPCDGELTFPFVSTPAATPTGLTVR